MTLILIISCFLTPYEIAFPNDDTGKPDEIKNFIDLTFDVLFFIQVISNFQAVVLTYDQNIIDNRK